MKGLVKYGWIFVAIAGAMAFTACNKNSNDGAGVSCPPGLIYNGATCVQAALIPGGIPAGTRIGFYGTVFGSYSSYPQFAGAPNTITAGNGLTALLRDYMGVCDRNAQMGGSNYGTSACTSWTQGLHDVVVIFDGSSANKAKLVVRSYPYVSPYYNYNFSFDWTQFGAALLGIYAGNMSGVYDPLILDMTVWPANNSQGFELRGNGPTGSYGWSRMIQFQALNSKIEDPTIGINMYVDDGNGQKPVAFTGTMIRCQSQNCGVQGL